MAILTRPVASLLLALGSAGLFAADQDANYVALRLNAGVVPGISEVDAPIPGTSVWMGNGGSAFSMNLMGSTFETKSTMTGSSTDINLSSGSSTSKSTGWNIQPMAVGGLMFTDKLGLALGGGLFYRKHAGDYSTSFRGASVADTGRITSASVNNVPLDLNTIPEGMRQWSTTSTPTGKDYSTYTLSGSDYTAYGISVTTALAVRPLPKLVLEIGPTFDFGRGKGSADGVGFVPSINELEAVNQIRAAGGSVFNTITGSGSVEAGTYFAYTLAVNAAYDLGSGFELNGGLGWMKATAKDKATWNLQSIASATMSGGGASMQNTTLAQTTITQDREFTMSGLTANVGLGYRF